LHSDEYRQKFADGEETIFNMITGMAGNMYLSGRLEYADKVNMDLIIEGIKTYKSLRGFIHNAYPIVPCGFNRIEKHNGFDVLMMQNDDRTETLLYVWRKESTDDNVSIRLESLNGLAFKNISGKNPRIEMVYPSEDQYKTDIAFEKGDAAVKIIMKKRNTARLFKISV